MGIGNAHLRNIAICYAAAMENENALIFILAVKPE
jgi:hypothetical protein